MTPSSLVTILALVLASGSVRAAPVETNTFWVDSSVWTPVGAEANGTEAVQALIERRLPVEYQHIFDLNILPDMGNSSCSDAWTVTTVEPSGQIQVNASTTVGLARGVYMYLRTRGGDMYWTGTTYTSQMLEANLDNSGNWAGCSWAKWRYLFNPVAFSYEMVWYDWPQWEYLLDWASLHGINLPLAIGGQEMIWADVFRDFGMSQDEILEYFAGPAFLSWQRLGNLQESWGQEITLDWIGKQWVLQKQIISRMVALGMTPVLPAFNGYVPATLHQYIGGNTPYNSSNWEDLPAQYTDDSALDPTWDTFKTVQSAFLQKQQSMYGGWTSHYYSIDLFNELTPISLSPDYLKANTEGVVQSLKNVDPEAVWIMQGWLFVDNPSIWNESTIEGLLSGAQQDEMIILDLSSEALPAWNSTNSFYGKNWVWNTLMDYGGNAGMYGSVSHYCDEVIRAKENSSSLIGVGLTPEGFNNNELVYEMALDAPWQTTAIDPLTWTRVFVTRRYGLGLPGMANGTDFIMEAWTAILPVAYNNTDFSIQSVPKSIIELVPATEGLVNRTGRHGTKLPYANLDLVTSCNNLLAAAFNAPSMINIPEYQYDMVVCTRQVLLNVAEEIYEQMLTEWQKTTNATGMSELGDQLLDILDDNDRVMAVNHNMLLSTWIGNARKWSDDPATQDFYEYQARNQITAWGPAPNSSATWELDRYATKQWAGLIGGFYHDSWAILVDYLKTTPPSSYNQTLINQQVRAYELDWGNQKWGSVANETWSTSSEDLLSLIAMIRPKWAAWLGQ